MLKSYSSKDDFSPEVLEALLSRVTDEVHMIYPGEMAGVTAQDLSDVSGAIRENFSDIRDTLCEQAQVPEMVRIAELICESDEEPFLISEKLNVTGVPYRMVGTGDLLTPVVVKTGNSPENGVWFKDRVHISSFAMLAEEMHGQPVGSGLVIYASTGAFRKVRIHSKDRRQVLRSIGRVRKIKEGTLPDKKESPLCESCDFSEMCNVSSSLASKFF